MMFKTFQGVIEEDASQIYLRPETAQRYFLLILRIFKEQTRRKNSVWSCSNR